MPPPANPYLIAIIAVSGTLLGAITAGIFALIQSGRNRKIEREKLLWSERRRLYVEVISLAGELKDELHEFKHLEFQHMDMARARAGDARDLDQAKRRVDEQQVIFEERFSKFRPLQAEIFIIGNEAVVRAMNEYGDSVRDVADIIPYARRPTAALQNIEVLLGRLVTAIRKDLVGARLKTKFGPLRRKRTRRGHGSAQ